MDHLLRVMHVSIIESSFCGRRILVERCEAGRLCAFDRHVSLVILGKDLATAQVVGKKVAAPGAKKCG